jgi:hypothetical protein
MAAVRKAGMRREDACRRRVPTAARPHCRLAAGLAPRPPLHSPSLNRGVSLGRVLQGALLRGQSPHPTLPSYSQDAHLL